MPPPAIAKLERDRPIAVLLHDVLPYLGDDDANTLLEALTDWLPLGSVLSLTHTTADFAREALMEDLVGLYADVGISFRPRTAAQVRTLLAAWTILDGGELVTTAEWHSPSTYARLDQSHAYAAIATPPPPGTAPVPAPARMTCASEVAS
ncbi:SAM-dependent methyltransferase [Streptomyces sp. NPDC048491]|uniref:SAM-dependent methyltransferase n=1 Tax=Streptomyces sp. NPDC048491 TaxID=3157207 RepID=UPI0034315B5D